MAAHRPPILRAWDRGGLIVDNFAGGGGASTGLEAAWGRAPDIAVNHDADAIAMHTANHPETRHYQEDVWKVDPREATGVAVDAAGQRGAIVIEPLGRHGHVLVAREGAALGADQQLPRLSLGQARLHVERALGPDP